MTQLQTDDFQKIQELIIKSEDRQNRDADRRFIELAKQIEGFNVRFAEGAKYYFQEHKELENRLKIEIKEVDRKVEDLDGKFVDYKTEIDKRTNNNLAEIIKILLGTLLGGGIYSIIQHTGLIK